MHLNFNSPRKCHMSREVFLLTFCEFQLFNTVSLDKVSALFHKLWHIMSNHWRAFSQGYFTFVFYHIERLCFLTRSCDHSTFKYVHFKPNQLWQKSRLRVWIKKYPATGSIEYLWLFLIMFWGTASSVWRFYMWLLWWSILLANWTPAGACSACASGRGSSAPGTCSSRKWGN